MALYLGLLGGFGLVYVGLGSIGNGIEDTKKWTQMLAFVIIATITYLLFFVFYSREEEQIGTVEYYDEDGNLITEELVSQESQSYESVVYYLTMIIGNLLMLIEIYFIFGKSIRRRCFNKESLVKLFTAFGIKAETRNKKAAAFKMKLIVDNARKIHAYSENDIHHGETSFGAGILNFSVRGEEYEEAGGFLWTWKRLFNKDLFKKDGIWISARYVHENVVCTL